MKTPFLPPESLRFHVVWAQENQFKAGESHFSDDLLVGWLWFVRQGSIEVEIDLDGEKSRRVLEAGDWFWHLPCKSRWLHAGSKGASWLTIGMGARCGERDFFAPEKPIKFSPRTPERGEVLMRLLSQTSRTDLLGMDGLSRALCAWLWSEVPMTRTGDLPTWLRTCLEAIEGEPHISVAELAKRAHFSPAQFRRLWEQYLGVSPRDFVISRRLERARLSLETQSYSVAQVASDSGFADAAQLSRAFKNHFGRAPLEWRKQAREKGL
jgi:AraC-like DNA-binding protein